jgi:site-specific DNA recombinase
LNSRELEDVVWEEVERVLKSPRLVKQEYQRRIEKLQEDGELTEEKKKLKSQKNSLEKSISRLIDSYSEGLIEKHEFEPRIRHLKEALQKNIQEERSLEVHEDQKKYLSIVIRRLDDFADMVRSGLKNATEEKKREIILAVIKRIEIGENDVNIVFRVDQMRESDHKNVEHCCRSFKS